MSPLDWFAVLGFWAVALLLVVLTVKAIWAYLNRR